MTQQQTIAKGDTLQRISSAGFITAAILMVIGNLLMPYTTTPTSNPQEMLSPLGEHELRTEASSLLLKIGFLAMMIRVTGVYRSKGMEESMPIGNFIGKHIRDVLSEPAVSQTPLSIKRSLATNRINMFEFEEKMGKEIRAMEARIVPSSATTTIMMIRDITQRKWIETEREKFIRELEVKNRESETLRESLASIVTIFDIEMVMERILDQIKQVIPYDTASVWRVDGEWQTLMIGRDLPPEIPPESLKFKVDENNSSRPILYGGKSFVLCNKFRMNYLTSKDPIPMSIHGWRCH